MITLRGLVNRLARILFNGSQSSLWLSGTRLLAVLAAVTLAGFGSTATGQADKPAVQPQSATQKTQAGKPQPQDPKSDTKIDERKRFQPHGYVRHEHEITISGQARNEAGEPVAGARVFIVPVIPMGVPSYDKRTVLAEGKTGADGCYRFDAVRLSVLEFAPQAVPRPSEALFQVFAVADGYGYVWRRTHGFRPEKRPADSDAPAKPASEPKADGTRDAGKTPDADDLKHVFFAGEPVVLDLEFSPEVRLHGTIRDDLGNPLKNAVVQAGLVNSSRDLPGARPRSWSCEYLEDSRRGVDGQFNGFTALPEEFRIALTDDDGHYELRGLPRDCSLLTYLDYLPEYDPSDDSLHTGKAGPARGRFVGYAGELNHVFNAPVTVRVKVLDQDAQPLGNVVVRQESDQQVRRAGSLDRTDAEGTALLKLRPGKCVVIVEPTIGQPYLPQKRAIELKRKLSEHSIVVELESATQVVFEAVEKETGTPIPGVSFLSEPADARERKSVQSQLSFVDHPRTDEKGRMQAFFEPGERRFFVDRKRSPHALEPLAPTTEIIDLSPDNPTHLRFEFTRRTAAEPRDGEPESEPIAGKLKPLAELLQKQAARFERSQRARFNVRRNNHLQAPMSREQMTQFLDSLASKTVEESLESIRGAFPDFSGLGAYEIITDGMRRRVEFRYPGRDRTGVNVFNGEETIVSADAGRQLDIFDRDDTRIGFLGPRDFWDGPANPYVLTTAKQPAGEKAASRTIRHADGAWEIELIAEGRTMRWIIDDATGFERLSSHFYGDHKSGQETRQFFPTPLATGVAVPKLSVRGYYQDAKLQRCEVTFIDKVELLESLPAEVFIVAAPAGTNILDYRGIPVNELGGGRRAPSGVVSTMVPDVVAHRNRFAPAGEPVLKIGDEVPELNVLTWLNAAGKADRPDLAGKVIVIDFWGIGCGPCVAQLPEVNAAAKHFADSKIIIVGLHDSSGGLEQVVEFAQKRGLVFPISIDRPDRKSQSFGATFSAFGIVGIPSSVVIDSDGSVAYIGKFQQAIEVANKLILPK